MEPQDTSLFEIKTVSQLLEPTSLVVMVSLGTCLSSQSYLLTVNGKCRKFPNSLPAVAGMLSAVLPIVIKLLQHIHRLSEAGLLI